MNRVLPKHVLEAARRAEGHAARAPVSAANTRQRRKRTILQADPPARNGLETEYSAVLEARKRRGEILDYGFNRVRLRLANGAWYKPDFDVTLAIGAVEYHETKGFQREAAILRVKVAASNFIQAIVLVRRDGRSWNFQRLLR
jgi:hypothetical protein